MNTFYSLLTVLFIFFNQSINTQLDIGIPSNGVDLFYFIAYCTIFTVPPVTHVTTHTLSFPPTAISPPPPPHRYIGHHALHVTTTGEDPILGRNVW